MYGLTEVFEVFANRHPRRESEDYGKSTLDGNSSAPERKPAPPITQLQHFPRMFADRKH